MATISTDTFLDDGTARTAGESWGIYNGATLTIRTDSRQHIGAPAGMTGTMGAINFTSKGKLFVEGRNVRWMPYDSGTGTVPSIGTTITQGGVSGYLLGVWQDYSSAPSTAGSTMPAAGFIKFREVSGGTFSAGPLSGILANATAPDDTGWIEIVHDSNGHLYTAPTTVVEVKGTWFYHTTLTDGNRGQEISLPTNGGGNGTHYGAVQIETGPGTGIYEWWVGMVQSQFLTTQIAPDSRSKCYQTSGNGIIRFGNNGTTDVGIIPPAGCRIRIPNVIYRYAATSSRSVNVAPTTSGRPNFKNQSVAADTYNLQGMSLDMALSLKDLRQAIVKDCFFEGNLYFDHIIEPPIFDNSCIHNAPSDLSTQALYIIGLNGGTFTNSVFAGRNKTLVYDVNSSSNLTYDNCTFYRLSLGYYDTGGVTNTNAKNMTYTNCRLIGCGITFSSCNNNKIQGIDFIARSVSDTSTSVSNMMTFNSSGNIVVDGITFGNKGELINCAPWGAIAQISNNTGPIKIRNAGTPDIPLQTNTNTSLSTGNLASIGGVLKDVYFQRVYIDYLRASSIFNNSSAMNNIVIENCGISYGRGSNFTYMDNATFRGIQCSYFGNSWNPSGNPAGTHFADFFISATDGQMRFSPGSLRNDTSYAYITDILDSSNPNSGHPNAGTLNIPSAGDTVIIETPYWVRGHTGFKNQEPLMDVMGNVLNMDMHYDIDSGSGYSGTWKLLTAANLVTETIYPSGFKMKVRIVAKTNSTNTSIGRFSVFTTTTTTAQADNFYPLDTVTLSFEGLKPGSEVRVYEGTDPATAVEIGGIESVTGTTWSFTHSSAGQEGYIAVFALGYNPLIIPRTYSTQDSTLLISQVVDRTYNNPI